MKQPEIAELLIRRGASNDPQMCDTLIPGEDMSPKGYTPLHYAAALGYERILKILLQGHYHTLETDVVTPLHLAIANGHLGCAKMLVTHHESLVAARPCGFGTKHDRHFLNSIIGFTKPNHPWRLTKALQLPNSYGGTALHLAVAGCHEALIVYLVNAGVEIDLRDQEGFTALHISARCGHVQLAKVLIQLGANVNCRAFNSWTPLHQASINGQVPIVLELSRNKANPTLLDSRGRNAMELALSRFNEEMVSCLFGLGLKVPKPDPRTCSPLCSSILQSKSLSLFLLDFSWGCPPMDCYHRHLLLITAYEHNHPAVVRRLLHKLKDWRRQWTAHESVSDLSPALCHFASHGRIDLMEDLLEAGADINGFSRMEDTPLGTACAMGQLDAVKYLIKRGAKTSWKDQNGRTVSAVEKAKGYQHVLKWLQDGANDEPVLELRQTMVRRIASSTGNPDVKPYPAIHECDYAVFDSRPLNRYGVRRRKSFISEYIICQNGPIPMSPSKTGNRSQRKPMWDSKEIHEQNKPMCCEAICKRRDRLLPERYSSYPLSKQILRVAWNGPWEIS